MTYSDTPNPSAQNAPNPAGTASAAGQPSANAGFCQQCGTALNDQTRRSVGGAVYCESCLQARLNSVPGYTTVAQPYAPWPPTSDPGLLAQPNPVLAGLLGFIPGVGAMYNEQYAKGLAHLAIFALLVVFADTSEIFGLGIAGWEFYMALEAYHTARARRAGLPLPNPFGFNDLGERLGFGKGWSAPNATPPSAAPFSPVKPYPAEPFSSPTGPSGESWPQPVQIVPFSGDSSTSPFAASGYVEPPIPPVEPVAMDASTRFPASAFWLILLGFVFLLSTTGLFRRFSGEALLGWSLAALSGWLFVRRLRESAVSSFGTLGRVSHALQGAVWVLTVGVLALLDASHLLRWDRSWPIFLIVAGGLALVGRLASQSEFRATMPVNSPAYPAADRPR